jgi:aminoglycoside 3-N-acetyltransferase
MGSVTMQEIAGAVRSLGLSGMPVCVHSSLRSFGWVEGGPDAVIDAFLAEGCTLMVPTFSYHFNVAPPADDRPRRNGRSYQEGLPEPDGSRIFVPESPEVSREEMGAIPATVLGRVGRVRGNHPLNSFTAVGPLAHELVRHQTAIDVYAPLDRLVENRGLVLLMGVGLDTMTLLHRVEQRSGRRLLIRWGTEPRGTSPARAMRRLFQRLSQAGRRTCRDRAQLARGRQPVARVFGLGHPRAGSHGYSGRSGDNPLRAA